MVVPGDSWSSQLSATFTSKGAFVEYDLGEEKPIAAVLLQGDNNDVYQLQGSLDGKTFATLWAAPPVPQPGHRVRYTHTLKGSARYLRIRAVRGDRALALTELQVFSTSPGATPPEVKRLKGLPPGERFQSALLYFTLLMAAFLLLTRRGAPLWWTGFCALLPLIATILVLNNLSADWPVDDDAVSLARAISALVALMAVGREMILRDRHPALPQATMVALSLCAVLGFMSFFNLGHPQFVDAEVDEPDFVHNYDMRVYFPVAKYFDELRFDGLYLASVQAYIDDVPNVSAKNIGHVKLRDLTTHKEVQVRDVEDQLLEVKARFSPERWEEFLKDMRYFRETMGPNLYLATLMDHGGNATPYWLAVAYLLFGDAEASDATLTWGGLIDPVVLIFTFFVIARVFGWRTGLLAAVVFGANDFYMLGTNWAGATLRHDWLCCIALGICAMRSRRPILGGALLALSAMIRAFPALALFGMAVPFAVWLVWTIYESRRLPKPREIWETHATLFKTAIGAIGCVLFCLVFSSIVLDAQAWSDWLVKVSLLDRDPHVNNVSLRALISGTHPSGQVLDSRKILYLSIQLIIAGLFVVAMRRRALDQAGLLALCFVPIVFNPANYYTHLIFAFPMLAPEYAAYRDDSVASVRMRRACVGVWATLLIICVCQYFEALIKDLNFHFFIASALLFTGFFALFWVLISAESELHALERDAGLLTPKGKVAEPSAVSATESDDSSDGESGQGQGRANADASAPMEEGPV